MPQITLLERSEITIVLLTCTLSISIGCWADISPADPPHSGLPERPSLQEGLPALEPIPPAEAMKGAWSGQSGEMDTATDTYLLRGLPRRGRCDPSPTVQEAIPEHNTRDSRTNTGYGVSVTPSAPRNEPFPPDPTRRAREYRR